MHPPPPCQHWYHELWYHVLVDCIWAIWSDFSNCDKSCGGGQMYKTRSKVVYEQSGGFCIGEDKAYETCNTQSCPGKFKSI